MQAHRCVRDDRFPVPWLEIILGLLLIAGVWLPGTAALTNVLLLSFFTALLINMLRRYGRGLRLLQH